MSEEQPEQWSLAARVATYPERAGSRRRTMRRLRKIVLGAAFVVGLGFAQAGYAQDFGSGLSAYYGKNYVLAAATWLPLAERGEPKAQSGLAYLYLNGLGVIQDFELALYWYTQAAEQDEPEAQAYLGSFYTTGFGVERDLVQAL